MKKICDTFFPVWRRKIMNIPLKSGQSELKNE